MNFILHGAITFLTPPHPPPPPPETYPHLGYHPSPQKKCSTVHKAYTKRCQFMTFEKVTIVWLLTNASKLHSQHIFYSQAYHTSLIPSFDKQHCYERKSMFQDSLNPICNLLRQLPTSSFTGLFFLMKVDF